MTRRDADLSRAAPHALVAMLDGTRTRRLLQATARECALRQLHEAVPALRCLLEDPALAASTRAEAALALADLEVEDVRDELRALVLAADSTPPFLVRSAVAALARLRDRPTLQHLLEALAGDEPFDSALGSTLRHGVPHFDDLAVPGLRDLLRRPDLPHARQFEVVRMLLELEAMQPDDAEPLCALLGDAACPPGSRDLLLRALGSLGEHALPALPAMLEQLRAADSAVQDTAARALVAIAPVAAEARDEVCARLRPDHVELGVLYALSAAHPRCTEAVWPTLARLLSSLAGDRRYDDLLGRVVYALVRVDQPDVRQTALAALEAAPQLGWYVLHLVAQLPADFPLVEVARSTFAHHANLPRPLLEHLVQRPDLSRMLRDVLRELRSTRPDDRDQEPVRAAASLALLVAGERGRERVADVVVHQVRQVERLREQLQKLRELANVGPPRRLHAPLRELLRSGLVLAAALEDSRGLVRHLAPPLREARASLHLAQLERWAPPLALAPRGLAPALFEALESTTDASPGRAPERLARLCEQVREGDREAAQALFTEARRLQRLAELREAIDALCAVAAGS